MPDQAAIALGLALLGPTEHGEQFAGRFSRQQRLQKGDSVRDVFQIDVKVGAREAEQDAQLVFGQHRGIDHDSGLGAAQGDCNGRGDSAPDHVADQVGARGLIKNRIDDFE